MRESWTSPHLQRKRRVTIFRDREPPEGGAPPRSREELGLPPVSCGENPLWMNFQCGKPEVHRSALPAPGSMEPPAEPGPMTALLMEPPSAAPRLLLVCYELCPSCFDSKHLSKAPCETSSGVTGEDTSRFLHLSPLPSPCFCSKHWKLAHSVQRLLEDPGFMRTHRLSLTLEITLTFFFLTNTPSRAWPLDLFDDSSHSCQEVLSQRNFI